MRSAGNLVLAFTLFAAIAVGTTGVVLLKGFRSTSRDAVAERQALILETRAHVLEDELDRLQADMAHLAQGEGVDLADDDLGPEKRAVALTASESAAFPVAAVLLERSGRVVWSEPAGVRLQLDAAELVRQAVAHRRASVTFAPEEIHVLVGIADRGAIVGIVRVRGRDLLSERFAPALGENGSVSLFRRAAASDDVIASTGARVAPELRLDGGGQRWMDDASGARWLVTEYDVLTEGKDRIALRLVQSAPELERDFMRRSYRLAAIVVVALLLAVVGGALFSSAIRRLEDAQFELLKGRGLAAMGKTSLAVAHEVKNSLNGLSVALDLLASRRADAASAQEVHAQAKREIGRLRGVAEDLTLFSARPHLERRELDLNALCRTAVEQHADLAAECGAEATLALDPEPLWSNADEVKVLGAIENLVRNGLEAMGPGAWGEEVGASAVARERRLVVSSRREGADAVIEVADTGAGLREDVRRRLFEPFVTTKRTGSGLGLAIVRRVVEAHGGAISAEDRPGGGTVFRMRLPGASRGEREASAISG